MLAPSANFATAGAAVAEDSGPISANDRVYSQVTFPVTPTIASGVHQVSFQLEQDSAFPIEDVISAYAAESVGRVLATYSVSGTGSGQPLGLFRLRQRRVLRHCWIYDRRYWRTGESDGC